MRKISKAFIAICLALIMGALYPVQVLADVPNYISEIKIGMGETVNEAAKALEGYTILKDGKNYADLNEDAGNAVDGGEGEKAVLLGYKTTSSRDEAITDLALVNMKGDYSMQDYGIAIDKALNGEIIPFVRDFMSAIQEYRENYNSDIPENQMRAEYFHDALNRLYDDDTGKGLGDLLLNETKFEMGDKAYDKLSDKEKKNHCDILTLLLQCNGKALILIRMLIAWATDANEETWLERLSNLTYDKMLTEAEDELDLGPTDAKKYLKREYEDDARKVLALWKDFQPQLANYEETAEYLDEVSENEDELQELCDTMEQTDFTKASDSEIKEYAEASVKLQTEAEIITNAADDVAAAQCLSEIEYGDSTMLDFFSQEYEDVEDDLSILFPVVAALSEGQRASLDFISLSDLVRMTLLKDSDFSELDFTDIEETSVYLGVDRSIYGMNSIAATPNGLKVNEPAFSQDPIAVEEWDAIYAFFNAKLSEVTSVVMTLVKIGTNAWKLISMGLAFKRYGLGVFQYSQISVISTSTLNAIKSHLTIQMELAAKTGAEKIATTVKESGLVERIKGASSGLDKFFDGLSYVLIIYTVYSIFSTWKDINNYYKVEFTPAPRYIVDLADVMAYNDEGDQVHIRNQTVHYEAVRCNRKSGDDKYEALNDIADMNGDVGRQWLALYATKNRVMSPILADSFVVKKGRNGGNLPAGYKKGIHLFGTPAALDLNTTQFDWYHGVDGLYVYYKTDNAASAAGSIYSKGVIAISAGCGLVAGAIGTFLIVKYKKKKENQLQTVN